MQIFLMFTMAIAILSYAIFGNSDSADDARREALATAAQMAVYHRGALDRCAAVACATGAVDPQAYLPKEIRDGALWSRNMFVSRYDSASKTLLTFMRTGFATRASVTFGTVAAALRDQTLGETTTVGQWDDVRQRVQPSYAAGWNVSYTVPAATASLIPKDSPVIVNRVLKP